jgi:hypothetical protein
MSVAEQVVIGATSPLEDAGILLHVLDILGPGHHLFISAVSTAWREGYGRIDSVQVAGLAHGYADAADLYTITSETTLYSAVFASAGRAYLAHKCGLTFDNVQRIERIAGRVGDIPTLQAAHELGLAFTDEVLIGAAESGSMLKLQWLQLHNRCELPDNICNYAARSGTIDVLKWLKEHGCVYDTHTCAGAAAGARTDVLQYLRDERCESNQRACVAAARSGHLATLQWLRERGRPWPAERMCGDAAWSGSIEMLLYLKQQGCVFNEFTMRSAAGRGGIPVCQYLLGEQCPCDVQACADAAAGGHLETVRFLHNNGCPWDATTICTSAASSGSIELMQYLKQQGCVFNEAVMSAAAGRGDVHLCQYYARSSVPGTQELVIALHMVTACLRSAGCMSRDAHGTSRQVA